MASPAIFSGRRSKLLTADGLLLSDGSKIDSDGLINYIKNGHAETGTTGWAQFVDASLAALDGTGGSPTALFQRTTSTPLRGVANFQFVTSQQWEGVSYAFTIDSADKAKVLNISFDYNLDQAIPDGFLQAYIYDVTNSTLIQPTPYQLQGTTGPNYKFHGEFQTSSNSTSYRLILVQGLATAISVVFNFDNVVVGPSSVTTGAFVGDWTTFTPTGTWSTNTTYTGQWRRVGSDLEVISKVSVSGAPTTATLNVNLPAGFTIDTTKIVDSTDSDDMCLGQATILDSGTTTYAGTVAYKSTTAVVIQVLNASATNTTIAAAVTQAVPMTFASGDFVILRYKVPIVGWSTSQQLSSETDTRVVSWAASRSATQTIAPNNSAIKITFNSASGAFLKDSHGAFDTSNNRYVVTVPGDYQVNADVFIQSTNVLANTYQCRVYVNGILCQVGSNFNASAGVAFSGTISTVVTDLKASDYIEIFMFGAGNNSASTLTVDAGANTTRFSGMRISGPSQIAASESVNARYNASATSISGSPVTIAWTTKDFDTHLGMSVGTYTVPIAGKYQVTVALEIAATYTLNQQNTLTLQKSGATVSQNVWFAPAAVTAYDTNMTDIISCVAGDTIRLQAASQGTSPTISGSTARNYITINRVGN